MLKTDSFAALLEVEMLKKCTPLWREARFEVKVLKIHGLGPLLDVQMSFRMAGARELCTLQKREKRQGFVAVSTTTTTTTLHYATLHSTPLHSTPLQLQLHDNYNYNCNYSCNCNCITLHCTNYITLQITLRYTTLNCTTLHYIAISTTTTTTTLH